MLSFFRWLNSQQQVAGSSRQAHRFAKLRRIWEVALPIHQPAEMDIQDEWHRLESRLSRAETEGTPRAAVLNWRWAAVTLALGLSLAVGWWLWRDMPLAKYRTARAQWLDITLADGSQVELMAESLLEVVSGYNADSRTVILEGEAYFSVVKGENPFCIKSGSITVKVLGTQFNVFARAGQLEVAVNEGIVEVSSTVAGEERRVTLAKGEYTTCYDGAFPLQPKAVKFHYFPGLRLNQIPVHDASVHRVCADIERRFNVEITLTDPTIAEVSVSGLFEGSAEAMVRTLCALIDRNYRKDREAFIIE